MSCVVLMKLIRPNGIVYRLSVYQFWILIVTRAVAVQLASSIG